MNENNKSIISKDDLLNVREIIEKEMHQEVTDPLFLTDIISIDENKTDKNKLLQSNNINLLIKNVIKDIISQELKIPIHFIGVGESIEDLSDFNIKDFSRLIVGLDK